jgi:hypothetical protein
VLKCQRNKHTVHTLVEAKFCNASMETAVA